MPKMLFPSWFGNQFNYEPAVFPGYSFPKAQTQQGLFAPPPSLFGLGRGRQEAGGGPSSFESEAPEGTGLLGPVAGTAQDVSDFATNPGVRGLSMAIPGVSALLGIANTAAQYSMAPPDTFTLGNFFSSLAGFQPSTQTLSQMALDPMGNFTGFDSGPMGMFGGLGEHGDAPGSIDQSGGGGDDSGSSGGDSGGGASGAGDGPDGASSGDAGAGDGSDGASGGDAGGGDGFSKGGLVRLNRLMGMNPPGPDDGYGALDSGEFVLTAGAVKKLGPENVAKLNAGEFDKKAVTKALKAKNPKVKLKRTRG